MLLRFTYLYCIAIVYSRLSPAICNELPFHLLQLQDCSSVVLSNFFTSFTKQRWISIANGFIQHRYLLCHCVHSVLNIMSHYKPEWHQTRAIETKKLLHLNSVWWICGSFLGTTIFQRSLFMACSPCPILISTFCNSTFHGCSCLMKRTCWLIPAYWLSPSSHCPHQSRPWIRNRQPISLTSVPIVRCLLLLESFDSLSGWWLYCSLFSTQTTHVVHHGTKKNSLYCLYPCCQLPFHCSWSYYSSLSLCY